MILAGQGSPEKGHDPIARELVDGTFTPVDFVRQSPKIPLHDLVHLLEFQPLREGRVVDHICEQDRHLLPFPLEGFPGCQDSFGQGSWGVVSGLRAVDGMGFPRSPQIMSAFAAELGSRGVVESAVRTRPLKLGPAFRTKQPCLGIFGHAFRALQPGVPRTCGQYQREFLS